MKLIRHAAVIAAIGGAVHMTTPAQAFFHLWRFSEAFSNSAGDVQFIEMRTTASNEIFSTGVQIRSVSTGKTFTFNGTLTGPTTNKNLLIATTGFESLPGLTQTPPLLTPDFILPPNFFNPAGDTLNFCQGNCTGFNIFDTKTFASVPTDGVLSLNFPSNATATNSPANYAGTTGSVNLAPPTTTGDYNGDLSVDAADYTVWRDTLGAEVAAGSDADGDADGTIDDGDYDFWKIHFGEMIPAGAAAVAVPEPAATWFVLSWTCAWTVALSRWRPDHIGQRLHFS